MQLRFRTTDRHAELGGDLFVLPAFDVVQHQYRTRPFRQAGDGALQIELFARALPGGIGRCLPLQRRIVGFQILATTAAAQLHQGGIDRQPMQPGGERALETEAGQGLPGADEGLLHQIFGPCHVAAAEAPDDGIDAAGMAAV